MQKRRFPGFFSRKTALGFSKLFSESLHTLVMKTAFIMQGKQPYSGRSSSFSRLCQTFCTSSLSSRASSSLPISFS